jgi:hypothetical protein
MRTLDAEDRTFKSLMTFIARLKELNDFMDGLPAELDLKAFEKAVEYSAIFMFLFGTLP